MADYQTHDAANIFPLDEAGIPALAADVKAHGLLEPIQLCDGKVLDGRRRLRACQMAGVAPRFVTVTPSDPIAHVWSLNYERRHLDESQRAMAVVLAKDLREKYEDEAMNRKREGQKAGGRGHKKNSVITGSPSLDAAGSTRQKLGAVVGVGEATIQRAAFVAKNGVPELQQAVLSGKVHATTAARIAKKPVEEQQQEVQNLPKNGKPRRGGNKPEFPPAGDEPPVTDDPKTIKLRGEAINAANNAINVLSRVPKDNPFRRRRCFRVVADWLKAHW